MGGRWSVALAAAAVLTGCSRYMPIPRASAVLLSRDGLVVSNSPTNVRDAPERIEGALRATYTLLVANTREPAWAVHLRSARFTLDEGRAQADCRVGGQSLEPLRVAPGERYRVDCQLLVPVGAVSFTDRKGTLVLPVSSNGSPAELSFEYRFFVKDAS